MKYSDIEYRSFDEAVVRIPETRTITGYALVFNVLSHDLGGFVEKIERTAIDEALLADSDILALFDHNMSRGLLARSHNGSGTLNLTIDDHGLKYEFDAPNTPLGDEILEYIDRGDIYGSSFSGRIEDSELVRREDGSWMHVIHRFSKLFDVSPVVRPAYEQTEVMKRNLEEAQAEVQRKVEEEAQAEVQRKVEEEAQHKAELDSYFAELKAEINNI